MARYGADPLHKDVFIEMHTTDRSPENGCNGFGLGQFDTSNQDPRNLGGSGDFFERTQQIYDLVTLGANTEMNPDGTEGIALHFDVGVPNPNPNDASWGDFGAGNTCYADAAAYVTHCTDDLDPLRAWLFRMGIDDQGGGGQASPGNGCYFANSTSAHVHEIGHLLGVSHGGPDGTAAAVEEGANRRPSYPSRMNYRFFNINGPGIWENFGFSAGNLSTPGSSRYAQEINPFPSTSADAIRALQHGSPPVHVEPVGGGTHERDIDWNADGTYAGTTIWAEYRDLDNGRNARESAGGNVDPDFETSMYGTHMDAAIVGDVLTFAYVDYFDGPGTGYVYLKANSDGRCDLTPTATGSTWSYGPCIELGPRIATWLKADAVSIAPTLLPAQSGGGTSPGIIIVYRDGATLKWRAYYVTPNTGPFEASYSTAGSGTLTGFDVDADTEADVTLVEVPLSGSNAHGGVLMIYEDSSGVVRQGFLPAGSLTWQGPVQAERTSSSASFGTYGDVGAVAYEGTVYLALRRELTGGVEIYTLPPGSNANTAWEYERSVPGTVGSSGTFFVPGTGIDVEIAITPGPTDTNVVPPQEISPEFHVVFRDENDLLRATWARDLASLGDWTGLESHALEQGEESQVGAVLVYDDRAVVAGTGSAPGAEGLRAYRNLHRTCDAAPSGVPTSCTSDGYSPGRPSDLACGGTYCYSYQLDCNSNDSSCFMERCTSNSQCENNVCFFGLCTLDPRKHPSHITQSPFSEGHHPTMYCDYNDGVQMDWAGCQYLATVRPAPSLTSDFIVTPYDSPTRCSLRPVFGEPQQNGTCGNLSATSLSENDRILNPQAYLPPTGTVTCAP